MDLDLAVLLLIAASLWSVGMVGWLRPARPLRLKGRRHL